jgi:hypothetical protein
MKFGMLTIVLLLVAVCSYAQADTIRLKNKGPEGKLLLVTDRAPQAVYFGIGGSGPIFSVNYDRRFSKRLNGLGFTAGLGFFGETGATIFSVPASINYLFGRQNNFMELAAGATFATASYEAFDGQNDSEGVLFGHINVGYRHQPARGGFFVRTGISPIFIEGEYFTSFYLGLGLSF